MTAEQFDTMLWDQHIARMEADTRICPPKAATRTIVIGTFDTPIADIWAALRKADQRRNPERADWTPTPAYKPASGARGWLWQDHYRLSQENWKVAR